MNKRAEGMGFIGGLLFTLGAVLGIIGYSTDSKKLLYTGIGLAVLGVVAYKLVKV